MSLPPDRYSNKFLNAYINRHVHVGYLKMIEFYSPLGIRHVFLCSINNNKNENTYHFRCLQVCRRHFIQKNRRMTYRQYASIPAKRRTWMYTLCKSVKMLRIGVLFISKTLPYSFCACVRNTTKIVTFVIGKTKRVSFSLFLDASPQTQNALYICCKCL